MRTISGNAYGLHYPSGAVKHGGIYSEVAEKLVRAWVGTGSSDWENGRADLCKSKETFRFRKKIGQDVERIKKPSTLRPNSEILISTEEAADLDKYTLSNAIAVSVKLGIWEALLEEYVDSMEFVTEDLKLGTSVKMSREDVLRKHGELFSLRHSINLTSDLLDTPDFYWDRQQLEALYLQVCRHFSIARRTRVINEKINHCIELIGLLSSHLSDRHHVRLEWMVIILIMAEVAFEIIHYIDRFTV